MDTNMSRRSFVTAGAAAGIAATAGAVAPAAAGKAPAKSFMIPPDPVDESLVAEVVEADVVVIGSGVSGMVCAATVAQEGGNVVLFSASSKPVFRGGSNHGINTKAQQRYGIDYTVDTIAPTMKKQMASGGYRMDQQKWWRWINNSEESMNWLIDIMEGAGWETTVEVGYDDPDGVFSFPPSAHNWIGGDVTDGSANGEGLVVSELEKIILEAGNRIDYNTVAKYLEKDADGRVVSVIAQNPDGTYTRYVGIKGVVMAMGDFSGDREMMETYCPWACKLLNEDWELNYDAMFQFGGLYPGDGQKMGLWAGAAWQKVFPNAPIILGMVAAQLPGEIGVQNYTGPNLNKRGERYMNEDTTCTYSVMTVMNQPDMCAYFVWEADYANWYDTWRVGGTTVDADNGPKPLDSAGVLASWEGFTDIGWYKKGDTLEELLSQFEGLDVPRALETLERYNGFCESGVDEDYHKDPRYLAPVKTGPFFGFKYQVDPSAFLGVCGGLRTDLHMRVCDEDDQPIPGLYNIGTMVGDAFSVLYNFGIEGHSLGMTCITFGHLLGKELAEA